MTGSDDLEDFWEEILSLVNPTRVFFGTDLDTYPYPKAGVAQDGDVEAGIIRLDYKGKSYILTVSEDPVAKACQEFIDANNTLLAKLADQ